MLLKLGYFVLMLPKVFAPLFLSGRVLVHCTAVVFVRDADPSSKAAAKSERVLFSLKTRRTGAT